MDRRLVNRGSAVPAVWGRPLAGPTQVLERQLVAKGSPSSWAPLPPRQMHFLVFSYFIEDSHFEPLRLVESVFFILMASQMVEEAVQKDPVRSFICLFVHSFHRSQRRFIAFLRGQCRHPVWTLGPLCPWGLTSSWPSWDRHGPHSSVCRGGGDGCPSERIPVRLLVGAPVRGEGAALPSRDWGNLCAQPSWGPQAEAAPSPGQVAWLCTLDCLSLTDFPFRVFPMHTQAS